MNKENKLYIPLMFCDTEPWIISALGVFDDYRIAMGEIMMQIEQTMKFENGKPLGKCSPLLFNNTIGAYYIEAKDDSESYTDYYYILEVDKNEE